MSSAAADRVARWAADREMPNGGVTVRSHTGADFEAGRVHGRTDGRDRDTWVHIVKRIEELRI